MQNNFWSFYIESLTGKENASAYQHRRILEEEDDEEEKSFSIAKGEKSIATVKNSAQDMSEKESVQFKYSSPNFELSKHTQILTEVGESFLRGLDTAIADIDDGDSVHYDSQSEPVEANSVHSLHDLNAKQKQNHSFLAMITNKLKRIWVK